MKVIYRYLTDIIGPKAFRRQRIIKHSKRRGHFVRHQYYSFYLPFKSGSIRGVNFSFVKADVDEEDWVIFRRCSKFLPLRGGQLIILFAPENAPG